MGSRVEIKNTFVVAHVVHEDAEEDAPPPLVRSQTLPVERNRQRLFLELEDLEPVIKSHSAPTSTNHPNRNAYQNGGSLLPKETIGSSTTPTVHHPTESPTNDGNSQRHDTSAPSSEVAAGTPAFVGVSWPEVCPANSSTHPAAGVALAASSPLAPPSCGASQFLVRMRTFDTMEDDTQFFQFCQALGQSESSSHSHGQSHHNQKDLCQVASHLPQPQVEETAAASEPTSPIRPDSDCLHEVAASSGAASSSTSRRQAAKSKRPTMMGRSGKSVARATAPAVAAAAAKAEATTESAAAAAAAASSASAAATAAMPSATNDSDTHPNNQERAHQWQGSTTTGNPPIPGTTLMLRNIPRCYHRDMLVALLDREGFGSDFDFLYFPYDFQVGSPEGYAFINAVSEEAACRMAVHFANFTAWGVPGTNRCKVGWSFTTMGLNANIQRYRNSPVMHKSIPEHWKPLRRNNGITVPLEPPTKNVKPPRRGPKLVQLD